MAYSNDEEALAMCRALGLSPINEPLIDCHHTDVAFTDEDEAIGEAIAFFLGGIFVDTSARYFYREMTSIDIWRRVARALRVHGLCISNRTDPWQMQGQAALRKLKLGR